MAEVKLSGISKSYDGGKTWVIKDVNLSINDGEFVAFVGPSGCGKSTLLRMICGLEDITSGELSIKGERVNDLSPHERHVGMVFQSYALYPHMTVEKNMAFGLKLAKADESVIDQRVNDAARMLQLETFLPRKPKALSGGQRQRVAIGRSIVQQPSVFLFDEPLSNLDVSLRVQMRQELAGLHRRLKTTSIYVTHDQVEAMTLADRIVVLSPLGPKDSTNLEQVGPPLELYNRPANMFVAGFIGSPQMNFLDGHLESSGTERAVITLKTGDTVEVNCDAHSAKAGDKVFVGIRPEHISAQFSSMDNNESGKNRILTKIVAEELLGSESFIYCHHEAALGAIIIRVMEITSKPHDQSLSVSLPPKCCHLFNEEGTAFPRAGLPEVF
ncbi:ABC transporter ATP-binding protein [Sansalvadorimonas verongulae]|uniref:ABC transporter ATP-binding protein n=1 Tax=Sansalvadorimonas verongulae TaxID=2172824 RepID=UPI0012BD4A37|nr:sn-glycerol-3-phosphate ABC transporter ATP-binding protein UgpC [Sansalvadorimonas verongulae]MTI13927.1 sn-glycerol-3-phosphate ABC transporter ATP-binding protein UgpC [Sansalvadorimonas verongulae]